MMNKTELINCTKKGFYKVVFAAKKHSPEILIVAGVAGTVASAVMACIATTKINGILDRTKEDVEQIHAAEKTLSEEVYAENDRKKELTMVYVQTGMRFAKLYAPSIILGTLSITSILASNNILRKRNVALAAAYTVVDRGFKEYRSRVAERFGEEIDKELKYDIKTKKFEETLVDDESGKEKKVKTTVNIANPNEHSDYARFFDEVSEYWQKDSEYNLFFLRAEQNYANDRLKARGYLFLNEVYERLGIPQTKAGQIVGWIYNPDDPDYKGDNYVDFGIYEIDRERKRAFVNGYERSILLDFNVDGPILDSVMLEG